MYAGIQSSTTLRRAASLPLRIESGFIVLETSDGRKNVGDIALRVLDYFGTPHTLEDALRDLRNPATGTVHWLQLHSTILLLHHLGALVSPLGAPPQLTRGFAAPAVHIRMLNDVARTRAYLDAIAATVREGDIVVDVGTGTGILALAAARAGARRVYAIERSGIADVAEAMFSRNGLADRITLVRGLSTEVELPERADVLVAELVGMDPFDEMITELTLDANVRFLKPHSRLVPSAMSVSAIPVSVPEPRLSDVMFTVERQAQWHRDYGFDFSALSEATPVNTHVLRSTTLEARTMKPLADSIALTRTDFTCATTSVVSCERSFATTKTGLLNGFLIYFDLALAPGITLTTAPEACAVSNHWGNRVVVLGTPLEVMAGENFVLRIERRSGSFHASCVRAK